MTQTIEFEGTTHEFPDDFSTQDIQKALSMAHPVQSGVPPQDTRWDVMGDTGRSAEGAYNAGVDAAKKSFGQLGPATREARYQQNVANNGPVLGTLKDMFVDTPAELGDAVKVPLSAMGVMGSPVVGGVGHGLLGSALSYLPGMAGPGPLNDKQRAAIEGNPVGRTLKAMGVPVPGADQGGTAKQNADALVDRSLTFIAPKGMQAGLDAAPITPPEPPNAPTNAQKSAAARLAKAAARDDLTADDIRRMVDEMGPQATIADVGGNVRGLAENAANQPGKSLKAAEQLGERQYGQAEAIKSAALDAAGAAHKDELIAKRTVFTQPLYEDAFAPGGGPFAMAQKGKGVTASSYQINDPVIDDLLAQPESQQGLREGLNSIRRDNLILRDANPDAPQITPTDMALKRNPATGQWERVGKPNLRMIDAVKRGYDIILDSDSPDIVNPRTGTPTNKARQIAAFRDILINRTENQLPIDPRFGTSTWAAARNQWREMSKPIEALNTIDKIADTARDASDITGRLYGSPAARAKLAGLTNDPAKMADFEKTLQSWKTFAETNRSVTGNSRTFYRTAAALDNNSEIPEIAADIARGNKAGLTNRLINAAAQKLMGPSPAVADELAPLFNNNRAAQDQLLNLMRTRQQLGGSVFSQMARPSLVAGAFNNSPRVFGIPTARPQDQ